MVYTLNSLPNSVKELLLTTYVVSNVDKLREQSRLSKETVSGANTLFDESDSDVVVLPEVSKRFVIWGTDNYADRGTGYQFSDSVSDVSIIVPRVEKSKAEQSSRAKGKAEVFTPSWLCNKMNNMVDGSVVCDGAFNTMSDDYMSWVASSAPVEFKGSVDWVSYVSDRRMEITCGEAPYLMSRYDTTTGIELPVRDSDRNFTRIGLIDRKFRVIAENAGDNDEWLDSSLKIMMNSFGYEWQGDSLLLARLNFINTYIDYYCDWFGVDEVPSDILLKVAEIASWNLWQMDGLKMVIPLSCSGDCKVCLTKKKVNTQVGHDGLVSAMRFLNSDGSHTVHSFESFSEV